MEDSICLDTDFLVNFLRNKENEAAFIQRYENKVVFATTHVNLFELYYGAFKSGSPHNILKVDELSKRLRILSLSQEAVKFAGKVLALLEKNGEPLDFRDLLIGSIAQVDGFSIKTYNLKHFQRIPGLVVKQ